MATANDVLKVAKSQLGYKETPSGSNKTKYGKEYGLDGQPWCAIFVWYVFKHAGCPEEFYGGGKCAYCPSIADYYIEKKQTVSKSNGRPGDIVLFGFGHTNSQHIGIIEKKNSDGSYTCIEGNTSTGDNCNGGMVMRRKRYTSQINWIVRPNYAEKESYDGDYPVLSSPSKSVKFAKKQKGTYAWRGKDHHKYSNKFTKYFAGKYGIDEKGQFPRYKNDIAGDCDLFAFGYVLSNTDVPQTEIMKEMGSYRWWWSSNLYRWLKKNGKIVKTPKEGDVAFFSKGGKICTHICFVVKVNGNKITTMDKNGKFCKTYTRNKSLYLGFYRPDYNDRIEKGEKSENVKRLQTFLKWYGYDISVDGDFGNETESAVMEFKTKYKTGSANYVGLTTLAKMKEVGR